MAQTQVRLSTLAEIKVFSLESLRNFDPTNNNQPSVRSVDEVISQARDIISANGIELSGLPAEQFFKTVGIARQVRVDEDYGTQAVYGIGSPTRPRLIPNNFSANVTCERIQLDTRNLYDFMLTPEYFYSPRMQANTGILDALYYTYMFVRSKELRNGPSGYDIYALMPRTSSKTITNGDVMISQSVQLTGFKVNYGDFGLRDFLANVQDDITRGI